MAKLHLQTSDGATGAPRLITFDTFADFADHLKTPKLVSLPASTGDDKADERARKGVKLGVPTFLPATLLNEGGAKEESNIETVTLLALDYDDVTEDEIANVLSDELRGYRWAAHTTFSNAVSAKEGRVCYRIWVELSEPIPADQFRLFRVKFDGLLPSIKSADGKEQPDRSTRNPNRLMFAPACPDTEVEHFEACDWRDFPDADAATALEVAQISALKAVEDPAQAPLPPVEYQPFDRDVVLTLLRKAQRRKGDMEVLRAERLKKVLKGDAFVTSDSHDPTVDLARWLGDELPLFSARDIAKLVAPSLAVMQRNHASDETEAGFVEKVQSWRIKKAKQKASLNQITLPGQSMFAQADGVATAMAEVVDPVEEDDGKPWMLQKGNAFWFKNRKIGKGYSREFQRSEAETIYMRKLAGTTLSPFGWTKDGDRKELKFTEVARAGCRVVRYASYRPGPLTEYDDRTDQVYMSCCAQDPTIVSKEHPEVDAWLRAFFNEDAEAALDWLALYPQMKFKTPALLLLGERHAGKTLMIKALSRIYGVDKGLNLNDVDKWNSAVLRCPLIFVDEHTTINIKRLRGLIAGTSMSVRRKFMEDVEASVNFRMLFAVNDLEMLRSNGRESAHGLAAIKERILAVRVKKVDSLLPVTKEERETWSMTTIAEHVLWLSENRQVGGDELARLSGRGGGFDVTAAIAINSDASAAVCRIALDYISKRAATHKFNAPMDVFVKDGILHVRHGFIRKAWEQITNEAPRDIEITHALQATTIDSESVARDWAGSRARFWRMDPAKLEHFAEEIGEYDAEEVHKWLEKDDTPPPAQLKVASKT